MIIILMGVSGAGKTTIGSRLAGELGWCFFEGDDYHPPSNVVKMERGEPLDDSDRTPWLAALGELIERLDDEGLSAVIACSALKRAYRIELRSAAESVRFVYLRVDLETTARRLAGRKSHFMDPDLLPSQFATLEEPVGALTVDATADPETVVRSIRDGLGI